MSRTEDVLGRAERQMGGVRGELAGVLATRRGLTGSLVSDWIRRLREAADTLEELR